ncbi:hypothetical protein [Mycolicibacterium sp. HS_4_1]
MRSTKIVARLAIAGSLTAGAFALGTWNGGWEPDGGVCLFGACI